MNQVEFVCTVTGYNTKYLYCLTTVLQGHREDLYFPQALCHSSSELLVLSQTNLIYTLYAVMHSEETTSTAWSLLPLMCCGQGKVEERRGSTGETLSLSLCLSLYVYLSLCLQWLAKVFTPWHFSYFVALHPGIKIYFLGACII